MRWLAAGLCVLLPGCAAALVPGGDFRSPKGYQVRLPSAEWRPVAGTPADLEFQRDDPAGGIAVDATCGGPEMDRPLPRVLRHLTFGLERRRTVERAEEPVGGLPAARTVVEGRADGTSVAVEAVVVRGPRCVYDFLYVAPASTFEAGRGEFRRVVESLTVAP